MMISRPTRRFTTRIGPRALPLVISVVIATAQTMSLPERTDPVAASPSKGVEFRPKDSPTSRVDQRIELLSIVFRLAGSPEYNANPLKKYATDIDQYFAPFVHHPAVERARLYIKNDGVGFDAVMSMAVTLSPPPALIPRAPIGHGIPDERWGEDGGAEFIVLLRAFYIDSHFEQFFAEHRTLYRLAEERFDSTITQIDFAWFSRFFGQSTHLNFNFVLGMNNGPGFYGPHVRLASNVTEVYAVIGCGPQDTANNPIFPPKALLPLVIHEFSHSFVNPAVDAHWKEFNRVEKVYDSVAPQMEAQAYGDRKALVYESIVRAAVLVYLSDTGENPSVTARMMRQEELAGFFWMPELVKNLELYESERATYNSFDSWIPHIAQFYVQLGAQIDSRQEDFLHKVARVVAVKPALNHVGNVDPSLTSLTLETDKDVVADADITVGSIAGTVNPVIEKPHLSSSRQLVLILRLKEHSHYGFVIKGASLATLEGYPLQSETIEFSTR